MNRAIGLGALAALFFASTFVVNRAILVAGGSVLWLAGLRYLFTLPLLVAVVLYRGELRPLVHHVRQRSAPWLLWGTVGFGFFYLPLTWAAHWAPSWLVAGSWQLTIVLGSLLVPFIERDAAKRHIPLRELWPSGIILFGVIATEWASVGRGTSNSLWALVPIGIAAIAYPLGNRQMMRYVATCKPTFSVYQRTLGMTLGSMPFWIVTMVIGGIRSGAPSPSLIVAAAAVAVLSGVMATLLFFAATDRASGEPRWLARIEATQSLEIVFTMGLATLIFHQKSPTRPEILGLAFIMMGMLIHSLRRPIKDQAPRSPTWSG